MKKRCLAGLRTHQYRKLPVTMKMWMQFNVMPWISLDQQLFCFFVSVIVGLNITVCKLNSFLQQFPVLFETANPTIARTLIN